MAYASHTYRCSLSVPALFDLTLIGVFYRRRRRLASSIFVSFFMLAVMSKAKDAILRWIWIRLRLRATMDKVYSAFCSADFANTHTQLRIYLFICSLSCTQSHAAIQSFRAHTHTLRKQIYTTNRDFFTSKSHSGRNVCYLTFKNPYILINTRRAWT